MTFEIGTLCTKTAGRDEGLYCVVIDTPKENYVLIDGQTRRRVVNTEHLEASDKKVDVKKGASHAEVVAALKKLKIESRETKPKPATERQKKTRRGKKAELKKQEKKAAEKPKTTKVVKKEVAKTEPKVESKTEEKPKAETEKAETVEEVTKE